MEPQFLRGFSLRLLASAAVVSLSLWWWGDTLAHTYLPVLRWAYELLDSDHHVVALTVSGQTALSASDHVFRLHVIPDGLVMVGARVIHTNPQGWAKVSVLTAYLWQPLMVAVVVAASFGATRWHAGLLRAAWLVLFLCGIALIDLPFVLWAQVWQNYADAFDPDMFSPLLIWSDFLQRGGRFLLGGLAGVVAAKLAA